MEYKKILVSLVAVLALAVLMTVSASASVSISSIEVSGVSNGPLSTFAGESLPIRVFFNADQNLTDARIYAWISGEDKVSTERFDIVANGNGTYSKLISVAVPSDIKPTENKKLFVRIETFEGVTAEKAFDLAVQREPYVVEVLDVAMDNSAKAGSNLALDIVLKNRGMHFAEDTFVKATIPALGIERKAYFGDLSPVDQTDPDREDAAERRMYLSIPANAPTGVYVVEIEAYNADSTTSVTKKLQIVSAGEDSRVVSSVNSKTFAAGEKATYSLTLVNTGSNIRVYELVFDAPAGLTVDADESVLAVPAGSSKTVKMTVSADESGKYTFGVNVHSDGQLVKKESYMANVEGSKVFAGNATVLLTVVLAIIFVVLLVVLIVLLTRKPQKAEEFGESYY